MNRLIKTVVFGLFTSTIALVTFSQAALADQRDFTLENNSDSTILSVYVAPSTSDSWGSDVLGDDVLLPGYRMPIRFNSRFMYTCYYDIMVVTDDLQSSDVRDVDLCSTSTVYFS
jgi:hypothetical protein